MSTRQVLTSGAVVFSLKMFLAAMIAYFIAISFDLPRPFWSVATVYIVAHPLSGAISSKSAYRLLGTLLGGGATLVMIPNLVNEPILLSAAIIAWVSACTFFSLLDRTPSGYVALLAGYTVLLAGLPLVTAPANTFDTVVSRVEEIGLAIICASVVSHVVFPVHAGEVLIGRIDGWLSRARKLYVEISAGQVSELASLRERQGLAFEAAELRSFTTHLHYDGSRYRGAVPLMRGVQNHMVSLLPLLSELEDLLRSLGRLGTASAGYTLSRIESLSAQFGQSSGEATETAMAEIKILARSASLTTWVDLLIANVNQTVRDIKRISDDCASLRASLEEGRLGANGFPIILDRAPAPYRDIRMALLSALAVAVCLATSILFWIASGWSDGMTFAQISGVVCCLLATMDDPVPAMRKFADVTIGAIVAAFVYAFAILPMIDGFFPLVAAFGLFLVPAGICLAIPSLTLIGMGLCINFPLLLTLGTHLNNDFASFSNAALATVSAMIWTPIVCSLFRSVKAETNARRFLSVTRRHVANVAGRKYMNAHVTHDQMLEVAGLFASRAGKLPPTSATANADLMRQLRAGLHIKEMQELVSDVPRHTQSRVTAIFEALETLYGTKLQDSGTVLENALLCVDDLFALEPALDRSRAEETLLIRAAALRVCLSPDSEPPFRTCPPMRKQSA